MAKGWEKFQASDLVDVDRTRQEIGDSGVPEKVFCKNIYGVQFNTETKYWIPFRHGDIDLAKFTED